MGVEFLLLFGLGITGLVLTNLLTGETLTDVRPPSTLVGPTGIGDDGDPDDDPGDLGTPADDAPRPGTHPAPLARLLTLIAVSAIVLCSVLWGLGWLAAQAIARAVGG